MGPPSGTNEFSCDESFLGFLEDVSIELERCIHVSPGEVVCPRTINLDTWSLMQQLGVVPAAPEAGASPNEAG